MIGHVSPLEAGPRRRAGGRRFGTFLLGLNLLGCQAHQSSRPAESPEAPQACEARKQRFVEFLAALPERSVARAFAVELPVASVGAVPGSGPVLELANAALLLDGAAVPRAELSARLDAVLGSGERVLYVAAPATLEIAVLHEALRSLPEQVELRVLVALGPDSARGAKAPDRADSLARELLAERDPQRRAELARRGYTEFTRCPAFLSAVEGSQNAAWSERRRALEDAARRCSCGELETDSLQRIASAEQRAGASGLAYIPGAFLRDERCRASMPKRSLGKLVKQIEGFDAEFAGKFEQEELRFEQVVSNERLLNYFCSALPGETLAAGQRARATLYWRVPGASTCQAWRFEPLSPGAPMGTWRRANTAGLAPLAFHYWQAAEEIRLFGPVPEGVKSLPTDERTWECSQNYRLTAVDARSIQTETGTWFLDEAACRAAPEPASDEGCVMRLSGSPPKDVSE